MNTVNDLLNINVEINLNKWDFFDLFDMVEAIKNDNKDVVFRVDDCFAICDRNNDFRFEIIYYILNNNFNEDYERTKDFFNTYKETINKRFKFKNKLYIDEDDDIVLINENNVDEYVNDYGPLEDFNE